MALRGWKLLFSVFLLQTAVSWRGTEAKHYHPNKRALLAVDIGPIESTTGPPNSSINTTSLPIVHVLRHHIYYNSTFLSNPDVAMAYWVDLSKLPDEKVITHDTLSVSHRRAAGVTLSFEFPFYGHLLRNITIATGGFLYMGDHVHSWIAATQYIAPLMANFDPSISESSTIQYIDNGTSFTVQWDKVLLRDRRQDGPFTFQTTLLQNGDIIFVYKEIPVPVLEISNESHPVKVGCSDAYVLERTSVVFRKKTIYEYHRVDLKIQEITNKTAILLTALPTCLKYKDCNSCVNADIDLNCTWCEAVGKCSDGLDRNRQEWLRQKCPETNDSCPAIPPPVTMPVATNTTPVVENVTQSEPTVTESTELPPVNPGITTPSSRPSESNSTNSSQPATDNPISDNRKQDREENTPTEDSGIGAGGIFAIILVVLLVLGLSLWMLYAYRNPQSSSGQFLIKYRPSQWHWKSEESRYSASVHM